MFGSQKDRKVVQLTIEFNFTAIEKWLDVSGEIEGVEHIEKDWTDAVIQSYQIDILPSGQRSDMYFHRKKGLICQLIGGTDFLDNADQNIKQFSEKIQILEWGVWHKYLFMKANKKHILFAPLTEVLELQLTGTFNPDAFKQHFESKQKLSEQKINVPISFEQGSGKPKTLIEVWRDTNIAQTGVRYSNALGAVSASVLSFEVEY